LEIVIPWIVMAGIVFCLLSVTSCGFIDLRPITVSTTPSCAEEVLAAADTPVIVHFGTEMERAAAEKALSVTGMTGAVTGNVSWRGRDLYFVPVSGWSPGIRYTLALSGTVFSVDGRELRLSMYVSFYAVSKSAIPVVRAFSPADGGSVGVTAEDGGMVCVVFSCAMDRRSTEDAFSWDCPGEKICEWFDNDTRLEVQTKDVLSAWSSYRWSVSEAALSAERVPLLTSYTGQFVADKDVLVPEVIRTFPMVQAGGQWRDTGGSLAGDLGAGQAIGVAFNKAMDRSTALRAVSLVPSVSGRTEMLSESSIVFIPESDFEPERVYTLSISKDTQDKTGLKLGTEYQEFFTPDIPFLDLVSVSAAAPSVGDSVVLSGGDLKNRTSHAIKLTTPEVLRFSVVFSVPLSDEALVDVASRITLDVYFPLVLNSVRLKSVRALSADSVTFEWEGLECGTAAVRHFYKLFVPGGKGGITNGGGSYFREDRVLYFEVVP
jgi:hypothetical protein